MMAEISTPWGGITVGDAGPYSDDRWSDIWRELYTNDPTTQGYLAAYLNELEVTGTASPLQVDTGAGIVDGKFYRNSTAVSVAVPTPSVSTRIDLIVLRKSWSAQTVRITRIAGTEGGAAPTPVQTDGTTWDIPLAEISINTGGTIAVTDQRVACETPLSGGGGVSAPFIDTTAIVKGSGDATKLLRFEVDGFTSGNTRVMTPPDYDGTIVTLAGTETLTNKRITKRSVAVTQHATPTWNIDNGDLFIMTGLAQAITSLTTNLTGTPTDGQMIELRITDNGTARAITPGASFLGTVEFPLAGLTTTLSKTLKLLWEWSVALSAWQLVGKLNQA